MKRSLLASVINLLFRLYGLSDTSGRVSTATIRIVVFLIDGIVLTGVGVIIYSYHDSPLTFEAKLGFCSLFSFVPYHAALFWWRTHAGRIRRADPRNLSVTFRWAATVLVLANLVALLIGCIAAVVQFTQPEKALSAFVEQLLVLIVVCQGLIVYIDIAFTLRALAEEIERSVRALNMDSVIPELARIESRCVQLSETLCFPLTLMHVSYFILMVLDVPLHLRHRGCLEDLISTSALDVIYLLDYYLIMSSANLIAIRTKMLGRRVRGKRLFFRERIEEIRIFTMSEHGITLFGATLDWKFSCAFLGSCWGFTLTAFQLFLASNNNVNSCRIQERFFSQNRND